MKKLAIILVIFLAVPFVFFKLATLTKKPEPLVINAPMSEPSPIGGLDQSFLKIKLLQNKYEVSLFAKTITTGQLDSIEDFISKNENLLDRDKVAVVGNQEMKEFHAINSLLKKKGITRFRLNSK